MEVFTKKITKKKKNGLVEFNKKNGDRERGKIERPREEDRERYRET